MNKIKELKKRLADLWSKVQAARSLAEGEKRDLTVEELKTIEADLDLIDATKAQLDLEERAAKTKGVLDSVTITEPPAAEPEPRSVQVGSDNRAKQPFANFGEQLIAVARASRPGGAVDQRLLEIRAAATGLGEAVGSDGGFLVQKDFAAELLTRVTQAGILSSKARRIPISAASNGIKINAVDETSRATGSRWGGVRGYWLSEAETVTKSKPKFRQLELTLKKLVGLYYATDELLSDAQALGSVATQAFTEEFGFLVDDALVNGTGAGQPLGILNSGSLVSVAKETGQSAATILIDNIVKMYARMWSRSRSSAIWYINQDIEPQLFTMTIAVGTGGAPVYIPSGGLSQQPFATLLGRPVQAIEQCATLGTVGDIILADFSQYVIIEKGAMESASSIHVQFLTDETVFRFVLRIEGQPIWNSALTPFKGSNTQSPFIALATRA